MRLMWEVTDWERYNYHHEWPWWVRRCDYNPVRRSVLFASMPVALIWRFTRWVQRRLYNSRENTCA